MLGLQQVLEITSMCEKERGVWSTLGLREEERERDVSAKMPNHMVGHLLHWPEGRPGLNKGVYVHSTQKKHDNLKLGASRERLPLG